MPRRLLWICAALYAACLLTLDPIVGMPQVARASEQGETSLRPDAGERSLSMHFPWKGSLIRGMRLPASEVVHHVEEYVERDRFYGSWQLVQLVQRAAERVAREHPGAKLSLGELSGPLGGRIVGHHSHRNGRDVDLAFYTHDAEGTPSYARTFVKMGRRGKGHQAGVAHHFDDARNWTLISKLIDDDDARVQYIFVAKPMQKRLIAQAKRVGAPSWLIDRARILLIEPAVGNDHASHFHVRIYCPREDRPRCRDRGPFYAWYDGEPPSGQYAAFGRGLPLAP